MPSGTGKRIAGPAFIAASATDVYAPPAATIYTMIRHIHIANVTGGAVTFTMYVGATGGSAAGTELEKGYSVAANGEYDRYFSGQGLKMTSTDFLSALASAGSSLTITVIGDQFVV